MGTATRDPNLLPSSSKSVLILTGTKRSTSSKDTSKPPKPEPKSEAKKVEK
jgi:hypothetical protein